MELLPPQKFAVRQWRFGRKRRRSGTEGADSEGEYSTTILSERNGIIKYNSISRSIQVIRKS